MQQEEFKLNTNFHAIQVCCIKFELQDKEGSVSGKSWLRDNFLKLKGIKYQNLVLKDTKYWAHCPII